MGTVEGMAKCRAKKKAPGRAPGAKNRITKDLKTAYLEAFDKRGGMQGLLDWAETAPDAFYAQISKMLPRNVQEDIRKDIHITWGAAPALPEPDVIEAEVIDAPSPANSNKVGKNEKD
jgi:hypothetical protein